MRRKHYKLRSEFDYTNSELEKIGEDQVKFAGGLNILEQLEVIGAIAWSRLPKDSNTTTIIAKLDITMP